MTKTKEYKYLEKRLKNLEKHFDFNQSVTGITSLQEDRLKGFCILCHAEFEDYFESIAKRVFEESLNEWKAKKIANYQIASFFVLQKPIDSSDDAYTKSIQLSRLYKDILESNHGIKEDNIMKLYKPLGYRADDFDATLLSELNDFGKRRGESAHSSAQHTTIMLDKNTEFDRVNRILSLLIGFENTIRNKYKKL